MTRTLVLIALLPVALVVGLVAILRYGVLDPAWRPSTTTTRCFATARL